jgi:hypothetical protein
VAVPVLHVHQRRLEWDYFRRAGDFVTGAASVRYVVTIALVLTGPNRADVSLKRWVGRVIQGFSYIITRRVFSIVSEK